LRALPIGLLSRNFAILFTLVSGVLFLFAASQLNRLCLWLAFPVLFILLFYSYTKRFTSYSHLVLGFCLGMAPLGAWIAIKGDVGLPPILLCVIVTLWTAGFDIIYSCQDTDFDRVQNLFSIPKRFGVKAALRISTGLHLLMLLFLLLLLHVVALGWISLVGTAVVAGLLYYEHRLVRPNDLSKVNAAFFTVNGYISILLLIAIGLDKLI